MLRNVAIPLMLAASEAEAQTAKQIAAAKMAMKMDKDVDIPELIADVSACLEGNNNDIATAKSDVTAKEGLLATAQTNFDDAIKPADATTGFAGGAWTQADIARKAAVEAAEAVEAAGSTVGDLLDELNALHEVERDKARLYYAAAVAFQEGSTLASTTSSTHSTLSTDMATALSLKTAADAAVTAAQQAITDETENLKWLYCELGAVPTFTYDRNGDGTADHEASKPANWYTKEFPAASAAPETCTVPQVKSAGTVEASGDADATACTAACTTGAALGTPTCTAGLSVYTSGAAAGSRCMLYLEVRPAITYYNLTTGTSPAVDGTNYLSAETTVKKWNATVALAQAQATLANPTQILGVVSGARTTAGKIAYYEGEQKMLNWLNAQRVREAAYFDYIVTAASTAKGEADLQLSGGNNHVVNTTQDRDVYKYPTTWGTFYDTLLGTPADVNRFDNGDAGATKELSEAATARDGTAAWTGTTTAGSSVLGSLFRMHSGAGRAYEADGWPLLGTAIAQGTSNWNKRDYVTTWTVPDNTTFAAMNTWLTAQNTAANLTGNKSSALYKWWLVAKDASKAAAEWRALFSADAIPAPFDGGSGIASVPEIEVPSNGTNQPCNTGSPSTWANQGAGNVADLAACKKLCAEYAIGANGMVLMNSGNTAAETWGTNVYIPKIVSGAKWCSAYSWEDSTGGSEVCELQLPTTAAVTIESDNTVKGNTQTDIWATGLGSGQGKCFDMLTALPSTSAITGESINFAAIQKRLLTAFDLAKSGIQVHTDLVADADAQAGLEAVWMQAYYYKQYWQAIQHYLTTTTAGSRAETFSQYKTVIDTDTSASNLTWQTAGVARLVTANTTNLQQARDELAYKNVDIALKQAHVDLLGRQLNRVQQQLDDLADLTRVAVPASTGVTAVAAGELIAAQTKRQATYDLYNGSTDALSVSNALSAKNSAAAAVVVRNTNTYPLPAAGAADTTYEAAISAGTVEREGSLAQAQREAEAAWELAQSNVVAKDLEITNATTAASLDTLRANVISTGQDWNTQNDALENLVTALEGAKMALATSEKELADTTLACQVAAYDKYRETLDEELGARETALATIKTLLEAQPETPAPGTEGARCEKALSNGTYRPKRGEETCGGKDSGLCCGAARVWMTTGTTADSGWRTIETCQKDTAETYSYQPPRAPMATTMPTTVSVPFACIEGAKALAAAASAAAAAIYMLA